MEKLDRLIEEHLKMAVQKLIPIVPDSIQDNDTRSGFLIYGLSTEVLRFFLGNQWTNENVFSMHNEVSPQYRNGRKFLKTDETDPEEQYHHQEKVRELAELVFNFQPVSGFKERLTVMQNVDLESAVAELKCAALLAAPEFQFQFVIPKGIKGEDYEGRLVSSFGRKINCEIKSKSERAILEVNNLWRTFDDARKQLPKNEPAVIIIALPDKWLANPRIGVVIELAVEKLFRQSERIVAVVFSWEERGVLASGERYFLKQYKPFPNMKSSLYAEDITLIFGKIGRINNSTWINFRPIVELVTRSL